MAAVTNNRRNHCSLQNGGDELGCGMEGVLGLSVVDICWFPTVNKFGARAILKLSLLEITQFELTLHARDLIYKMEVRS